jgi:hypothetical protein
MYNSIWTGLYRATLTICILIIWYYTLVAHTSEYDDNYGSVIFALTISTIMILTMIILWLVRREIIAGCKIISLLFIITSSPISIIVSIALYQFFIGQYFKV